MIAFRGDYSEGAHERIMEALLRTNREQTEVYGEDAYSERAKALIREKIGCASAKIRFLVGGTQTNQVAIAHMLRPHQAVIATKLGHINVHETGAIEATGHKVLTVEPENGKVTSARVVEVMEAHADYHMVQPKLVYISNSTEIGTVYTRAELAALRAVCDRYGLYLYVDGARLAMALTAEDSDLALLDYPAYADAFYIGGTKNGALFGEALVVVNQGLQADLSYTVKQRGGLLAKGRLLGLQFATLFEGNLYEELGLHANRMGMKLRQGFSVKGYDPAIDSNTNQQFFVLEETLLTQLAERYAFQRIEAAGSSACCVRFVTSWATQPEQVEALLSDLPIKK